METFKILIVLFSLLFLYERKSMNKIFNFIGLIITVAVIIACNNADYISYLLIIIYCSALTIIFGFVVMLTPDDHPSSLSSLSSKIGLKDLSLLLLVPLLSFLAFTGETELPIIIDKIIEIDNKLLLNKIGELLYLDPVNISKFMIATLILLLALVALFFILIPTL